MSAAELLLERAPVRTGPLEALRAGRDHLSEGERLVAREAAFLLRNAWVNWSGAAEAIADRLERLADDGEGGRRALLAAFAALGDRHTDICLPGAESELLAFLPFLPRTFWEDGAPRLMVAAADADGLERGDVLIAWNGRPIEEELQRNGVLQPAANAHARYARAVQTLTFRPLAWMPPPETDEVVVTVQRAAGGERSVRLAWDLATREELAERFGDWACGAFAPGLSGRIVETGQGAFGLIRVGSLHARADDFVRRFAELLGEMPGDGLVIDLRGCQQGLVPTAERLLQLLGPGPIEPGPFEFRATPFVRDLAEAAPALAPWREGLSVALQRGDDFSSGAPITSPDAANAIGQRYWGPVVVLADALTYSSAEMFAAGLQDHGLGLVIGSAPCTGGGGASPWTQALLHQLSGRPGLAPDPDRPSLRLSMRRRRGVGRHRGRLIEGAGVTPDHIHLPTRQDLLNGEEDLYRVVPRFVAQLLSE